MRPRLAALLLACTLTSTAAAEGFDLGHFAIAVHDALAADKAGAWRDVPWQEDADAALAGSARTGKPLFVFVFITVDGRLAGETGPQCCFGGRATRGTSLSDQRVIDRLRRDFVCLALDCKAMGFPAAMPGLRLCQQVYEGWADPTKGFSAACVLTPDGRHLMGTSGAGTIARYRESICYDPAKYARFLAESLDRATRWAAADATGRAAIGGEVWRSVLATNTADGFAARE
ncbi:MAG TPA: hypothetical protein VEL07_20760 [Planctomycetota bacterium]|nr:hypothetical protein [Planctomycetota bacterium]